MCARVRPGTLPDHGVERVREEAARVTVEAAGIVEVPGFFEVTLDEAHVTLVVELVPDRDYFGRKAAVFNAAPSDKRPRLTFQVTLAEDSQGVELSLS